MQQCKQCGSYAINHHEHGRDGSDKDLCDVCYWRQRHDRLSTVSARYLAAAVSYNVSPYDKAVIRKYAAAKDALTTVLSPNDSVTWLPMDTAPKEGYPVQFVRLLMQDGSIVENAHWAYGGGEEQPAFGPAWFRPFLRPDGSVSSYYEVTGKPKAWAPLASLNAERSQKQGALDSATPPTITP